MVTSAAVLVGFGVYRSSGPPEALTVFWQSLVIAILVAVGAVWMSVHHAKPAQSARARGSRKPGDGETAALSKDQSPSGSGEQSITVKLLELIALGDRYGNAFSVALVRLDHLEEIDENYDVSVSRRVLKEVHSALAHTLRMPDRVGEYDHGAYVVVLPETNLPGAVQIAERLRTAVSDLEITVSRRVRLRTTISVGVTCYRRGDDLRSLLDRAGAALQEAENQGRNRVLPDLAA